MNHLTHDLIARYVHEVKRILGKKAPLDLTRELESLLAESVEARQNELGHELELAEVASLIAAFGTPEEVADRYAPRPACLIGPRVYPAFLVVAKILLASAAGLPLIVLLTPALAPGGELPTLGSALVKWLGLSYQIAVSGLASAVVVFAILERWGVSPEYSKEAWDPLSLPPVDDRNQASRIRATVSIYFVIALMILFNLFPQWLGIYVFTAGQEPRLITLDQLGIRLPMLALNFWWLVALLQNLLLLKTGRWTWPTRWLQFGLGIFGGGIVYTILRRATEALAEAPSSTAIGNPELLDILGRAVPTLLFAFLLVVAIKSAKRLYKLLRPAVA